MARKIIWSPEALADLTGIRDYIARDSENYAGAVVEQILAVIDQLGDFPGLGQRVPELEDVSIRQVIASRYRIVYRVREQAVDIAAIVDGARDVARFLSDRGF